MGGGRVSFAQSGSVVVVVVVMGAGGERAGAAGGFDAAGAAEALIGWPCGLLASAGR